MATDERPIEVGDRFEDRDTRNAGRVVEVREVKGGQLLGRARVQVEVHPLNPSAVGRHATLAVSTLRRRYRRLSR